MARTTTLSTLRSDIRSRADMDNSEFITDSELNSYINASYAELYDILVSRFEDYYTTTSSHSVASGASEFSVPADFYKLRGVDRQYSGNDYYSLSKFNFNQRNFKNRRVSNSLWGTINVNYRLVGNNIELIPEDQASGTYRMWYVPACPVLSLDADTVDGVNGFEEYIVVDVCIKVLEKEESDTTTFQRQKAALMKRIEEMAAQRDAGEPDRITDTVSWDSWWEEV